MPLLPTPECGDLPAAEGCDFLWLTGQALLDAGMTGIDPYLGDEGSPCYADLASFVAIGSPPADFGDRFTVSLLTYGPSAAAQARALRDASCSGRWDELEALWQVDLWAEGYPVVDMEGTRQLEIPAAAQLSAANQRLYVIGLAAYNEMMTEAISGDIGFPSVIDKARFGVMTPNGPQGGTAGWRWTVTTNTNT